MQARHEGALRAECTLHRYREKQQWSERKSYQKLPGTAALFKGFSCGQLSELKPNHLRLHLYRSPEVGQRPGFRHFPPAHDFRPDRRLSGPADLQSPSRRSPYTMEKEHNFEEVPR
jgi:hypothetical protein